LICLPYPSQAKEGEGMPTPDDRITPRFKLHTPLSFHSMETPLDVRQAKCINISTRGVYFVTDAVLRVGEAVEVVLDMPKRVTGSKGGIRRFTGRVTHIQPKNILREAFGIGVQLLYYARDLEAAPSPSVLRFGTNDFGGQTR
jgi:hypothetical protein